MHPSLIVTPGFVSRDFASQIEPGGMLSRFCVVLSVAACSAAPVETSTTGVLSTTSSDVPEPTLVTSTTDASTTGGHGSDVTTSTSGTPTTATTEVPDFGEVGPACNGKIDFLFVLDRANYMEPYWQRFHAAFPKFVDDVLGVYSKYDMHFMTVDGKAGWGIKACEDLCQQDGTCTPTGPADYPCEPHINGTPGPCEGYYGTGSVFPAGFEAANRDCGAAEGERFISSSHPELADAVKCIGHVGYGKGVARPAADMLEAVSRGSDGWNCNGDFLRDDAMLVVVLFEGSEGLPPCDPTLPGAWAETLYEAKGFDKDKLLVIGMIYDVTAEGETFCTEQGSGTYEDCSAEFLHFYVKHRVEGSICAESYDPYFEQGLGLLEQLCDPNEVPT